MIIWLIQDWTKSRKLWVTTIELELKLLWLHKSWVTVVFYLIRLLSDWPMLVGTDGDNGLDQMFGNYGTMVVKCCFYLSSELRGQTLDPKLERPRFDPSPYSFRSGGWQTGWRPGKTKSEVEMEFWWLPSDFLTQYPGFSSLRAVTLKDKSIVDGSFISGHRLV